jgi:hypothetical protein
VDHPTRRLDDADKDLSRACLGCGTPMISGRVVAPATTPQLEVRVALEPAFLRIPYATAKCEAFVCLECGYVELCAPNAPKLKELPLRELED